MYVFRIIYCCSINFCDILSKKCTIFKCYSIIVLRLLNLKKSLEQFLLLFSNKKHRSPLSPPNFPVKIIYLRIRSFFVLINQYLRVYNNLDGTNNVISVLLYNHCFLTLWHYTLLVCFLQVDQKSIYCQLIILTNSMHYLTK